jgi:4-hydroxybenzoate polyprenyltransferase
MLKIRLGVVMLRPAVLLLFGLFAMVGVAAARPAPGDEAAGLAELAVVLVSFLVFSVALNDIADFRIDRVNLAGDPARPLVAGSGTSNDLRAMAVAAALAGLTVAAVISWVAVAVVALGMAVSASYSLRPLRLADCGAVASLVLPACYVAVPFLLGGAAVHGRLGPGRLLLLAGLYLGFVGRIVIKDFRDVRGDALFGKRTFLVRHGRRATVRFSAAFSGAGTAVVAGAVWRSVGWGLLFVVLYGGTLLELRRLSRPVGHRREENLVSALAILGRGVVVLVLLRLQSSAGGQWLMVAAVFVAITLGQARAMERYGPRPPHLRVAGERAERREHLASLDDGLPVAEDARPAGTPPTHDTCTIGV